MINPEKRVLLIFIIVIPIITGCLEAGASSNIYQDEDILNEDVKAIAIFPYRNTSGRQFIYLSLDSKIHNGLSEARPEIEFINPENTNNLIEEHNLSDTYLSLVNGCETARTIDTKKLALIGNALDVDAILVGRVLDSDQLQGGAGLESQTYLAIEYYLLSTRSGKLLWQSITEAFDWAPGWDPPPPYENTVDMAVEKLVSDFPIFGEVVIY